MDYLIRAEDYAAERGDVIRFKNIYACFRLYYNIRESVWKTLNYLYSSSVADDLASYK